MSLRGHGKTWVKVADTGLPWTQAVRMTEASYPTMTAVKAATKAMFTNQ